MSTSCATDSACGELSSIQFFELVLFGCFSPWASRTSMIVVSFQISFCSLFDESQQYIATGKEGIILILMHTEKYQTALQIKPDGIHEQHRCISTKYPSL
jgi:hypothetical protein